jgi:hypothetical protein
MLHSQEDIEDEAEKQARERMERLKKKPAENPRTKPAATRPKPEET